MFSAMRIHISFRSCDLPPIRGAPRILSRVTDGMPVLNFIVDADERVSSYFWLARWGIATKVCRTNLTKHWSRLTRSPS